jgi:hypothetical protein
VPEQHLILDLGPGFLAGLAAFFTFLTSAITLYFAYMNGRKIDQANSHLALALQQNSNLAGESKLTITPIANHAKQED